jgi:hypothetical protein
MIAKEENEFGIRNSHPPFTEEKEKRRKVAEEIVTTGTHPLPLCPLAPLLPCRC